METLPDELLEKVFEFLLARDRKAGVLVNKRWREVGEAPKFWTWVKLPRVECRPTNQARVIEMIKSRRLAKVKESLLRRVKRPRDSFGFCPYDLGCWAQI